jgi:hypothetical protein
MITQSLKNLIESGWNAIGELNLARPVEKIRNFCFYLQAKLILNGIMGARLMLLLLVLLFAFVLIVDAATILILVAFKLNYNILVEPVSTICDVETHRLSIFADEDMKKVYFRLMANDRFQYYTEFAKHYGFYEKPKPIRYYEHYYFMPLWQVFEDRGLVAVATEKLRRTLLIFKPFAYIDGSMHEPWYEVHLQDLALKNELDTILASLRQSNDPVDLATAELYSSAWSDSLYARRWVVPKYELAAIVVSVLIFNMIDDAAFVPEYLIWERSVELLPKVYKYMFSVRRR